MKPNTLNIIALCIMNLSIGYLYSNECSTTKNLLDTIAHTSDDIDNGNYAHFSVNESGTHYHFPSKMQDIHKFVKNYKPEKLDYDFNDAVLAYDIDAKADLFAIYLISFDNTSKLPLFAKDISSEYIALEYIIKKITH